jgi:hypothetical protein
VAGRKRQERRAEQVREFQAATFVTQACLSVAAEVDPQVDGAGKLA